MKRGQRSSPVPISSSSSESSPFVRARNPRNRITKEEEEEKGGPGEAQAPAEEAAKEEEDPLDKGKEEEDEEEANGSDDASNEVTEEELMNWNMEQLKQEALNQKKHGNTMSAILLFERALKKVDLQHSAIREACVLRGHDEAVYSIAQLSHNTILSGSSNGIIKVWRLLSKRQTKKEERAGAQKEGGAGGAQKGEGEKEAEESKKARERDERKEKEREGWLSVANMADHERITGSRCTHTLEAHKHAAVWALETLVENRVFASGGSDSVIRIWEVRYPKAQTTPRGTAQVGERRIALANAKEEETFSPFIKGHTRRTSKTTSSPSSFSNVPPSPRAQSPSAKGVTFALPPPPPPSNMVRSVSSSSLFSAAASANNNNIKNNANNNYNNMNNKNNMNNNVNNDINNNNKKEWHCSRVLSGHKGWILDLQSLSHGRLASGSRDKTIKIWNWKTGECLQTLKGHTNSVWTLRSLGPGWATHPNEPAREMLSSGSYDSSIKIWDVTWRDRTLSNAAEGSSEHSPSVPDSFSNSSPVSPRRRDHLHTLFGITRKRTKSSEEPAANTEKQNSIEERNGQSTRFNNEERNGLGIRSNAAPRKSSATSIIEKVDLSKKSTLPHSISLDASSNTSSSPSSSSSSPPLSVLVSPRASSPQKERHRGHKRSKSNTITPSSLPSPPSLHSSGPASTSEVPTTISSSSRVPRLKVPSSKSPSPRSPSPSTSPSSSTPLLSASLDRTSPASSNHNNSETAAETTDDSKTDASTTESESETFLAKLKKAKKERKKRSKHAATTEKKKLLESDKESNTEESEHDSSEDEAVERKSHHHFSLVSALPHINLPHLHLPEKMHRKSSSSSTSTSVREDDAENSDGKKKEKKDKERRGSGNSNSSSDRESSTDEKQKEDKKKKKKKKGKRDDSIYTITRHGNYVLALETIGKGKLASGSWELRNEILSSSRTITTGHRVRGLISVWDISPSSLRQYADTEQILSKNFVKNPDAITEHDKHVEQYVNMFRGHNDWVHALQAMSSSQLASGSMDGTIKIWDTSNAQQPCLKTIKAHHNAVMDIQLLCFSSRRPKRVSSSINNNSTGNLGNLVNKFRTLNEFINEEIKNRDRRKDQKVLLQWKKEWERSHETLFKQQQQQQKQKDDDEDDDDNDDEDDEVEDESYNEEQEEMDRNNRIVEYNYLMSASSDFSVKIWSFEKALESKVDILHQLIPLYSQLGNEKKVTKMYLYIVDYYLNKHRKTKHGLKQPESSSSSTSSLSSSQVGVIESIELKNEFIENLIATDQLLSRAANIYNNVTLLRKLISIKKKLLKIKQKEKKIIRKNRAKYEMQKQKMEQQKQQQKQPLKGILKRPQGDQSGRSSPVSSNNRLTSSPHPSSTNLASAAEATASSSAISTVVSAQLRKQRRHSVGQLVLDLPPETSDASSESDTKQPKQLEKGKELENPTLKLTHSLTIKLKSEKLLRKELAKCLCSLAKLLEQETQQLQEAASKAPSPPKALSPLALQLQRQTKQAEKENIESRLRESFALYRKAYELDPSNSSLSALAGLKRIMERKGNSANASTMAVKLADIYFEKELFNDSKLMYEDAIRLDSSNEDAYRGVIRSLGRGYEELKQSVNALVSQNFELRIRTKALERIIMESEQRRLRRKKRRRQRRGKYSTISGTPSYSEMGTPNKGGSEEEDSSDSSSSASSSDNDDDDDAKEHYTPYHRSHLSTMLLGPEGGRVASSSTSSSPLSFSPKPVFSLPLTAIPPSSSPPIRAVAATLASPRLIASSSSTPLAPPVHHHSHHRRSASMTTDDIKVGPFVHATATNVSPRAELSMSSVPVSIPSRSSSTLSSVDSSSSSAFDDEETDFYFYTPPPSNNNTS
ncbi:SCF ubiquitin ligase complex subunit cdc4 [Balamuthia mandrillaris]